MKNLCFAGCGRPVGRAGSRCAECTKEVRAARARARRGHSVLPPLRGEATRLVAHQAEQAQRSLNKLEKARESAEYARGLDTFPFSELDLYTRMIRAELTTLQEELAEWQQAAKAIEKPRKKRAKPAA